MEVEEWYVVEFDDELVKLRVDPSGRPGWEQEIRWEEIERVCFRAEEMLVSNGIYIFTRDRRESYAIPVEARGGQELWNELIGRGLFDANLAVEAATSIEGLFCWPPPSDELV